jgi:hypothetical protein
MLRSLMISPLQWVIGVQRFDTTYFPPSGFEVQYVFSKQITQLPHLRRSETLSTPLRKTRTIIFSLYITKTRGLERVINLKIYI